MNIFEKIVRLFMSEANTINATTAGQIQRSATNKTSKTVISAASTMTLNTITQKNIEIVKTTVSELTKRFDYHPGKLLDFAMAKGTPVVQVKDAKKKLLKIKQEVGLIPALDGFQALYLNFITGRDWSMQTPTMIVIEDGKLETMLILFQFYKWYSFYMGLPGFAKEDQRLFRESMTGNLNMKPLNLSQLTGLQEAIKRDQEATDFTLALVREFEAAKRMQEKGQTHI